MPTNKDPNVITMTAKDIVLDSSSSITTNTIGMTVALTDEEQKQLKLLKQEKVRWLKQEKLKNFQKLPPHIRQDIVDEAYLYECVNAMINIDNSKFEDEADLNHLQNKEELANPVYTVGGLMKSTPVNSWYQTTDHQAYPQNAQFKYGPIINEFTKDELANAHVAATLEETLSE